MGKLMVSTRSVDAWKTLHFELINHVAIDTTVNSRVKELSVLTHSPLKTPYVTV